MLMTIDFLSDTPIYAQIRDQIIVGIARLDLSPGEALPSVRRMAADLGVNVNTVSKAYTILKDEGYLSIDRRSGCFVATDVPPADEALTDELRARLLPIAAVAAYRSLSAETFAALCRNVYEELGVRP